MRIKTIILVFLAGLAVLWVLMPRGECSWAEEKADKFSVKIGVVSVRKVFQECKRNARYVAEAAAEDGRVVAGLQKLSGQIEAERAGLRALKQGSSDYLAAMREILTKQASLQAQREFHKQQMELKDQQWTEQLYKDILRYTEEVAKEKGLDLVFEKDEVELPAPSPNELMMTIRTHKLLYSGGCMDITDEVLALVDAEIDN